MKKLTILIPPLLLVGFSFLIYFPVLDRYFVSDDFKVLYRVCREHNLFVRFFFRPLSDFTIFLNYQTNGLNPIIFNSFNILVHGLNGYLIYLVCCSFNFSTVRHSRKQFAIISALIFLCYPFHNEGVVWLLGRGASMACLFSLLAIFSFYRVEKKKLKVFLVCIFWFISLLAFESTIIFPLIFILLLQIENKKSTFLWSLAFLITFLMHLAIRYEISKSVLGGYGHDFFNPSFTVYLMNIGKVAARLILPPITSAGLFAFCFSLVIICFALITLWRFKKIRENSMVRFLLCFAGMLLISMILPVVTGVSTQTSESDRMLYFPSVFVCIITGCIIVFFIKNKLLQAGVFLFLLSYNIIFLEKNNTNWIKASSVTQYMIGNLVLQKHQKQGNIYFLNIPTEINGAFVFRQGFKDALRLYDLDSNRNILVNYLTRKEMNVSEEGKVSRSDNSQITFNNGKLRKSENSRCLTIYNETQIGIDCHPGDLIYLWNPQQFVRMNGCDQMQE